MAKHKNYFNIIVAIITGILICLLFFLMNRDIFRKSGPEVVYSSGTFSEGETLYGLLSEEGIARIESAGVDSALNPMFKTKNIRQDKKYELFKSTFGTVYEFNYYNSPTEYFNVKKSTAEKFLCDKMVLPAEKVLKKVKGEIEKTLYESMSEEGVSGETIMTISDIFAWQIDFFNDPRPGDKFSVVYNQFRYKGDFLQDGDVIAAVYDGSYAGRYTAIYFQSADGKIKGYFTPEGGSLRKMFLKAPLNYRRISSYFTYGRFHPILRYFRPHLGIDYAAPAGTPVSSIGEGTVTFAGWNDGFGKFVKIRHNSVYTTTYGHLSKITARLGARVHQGDVIGKVGSTGLSTGPHLDFRINRNGRPVNFLKLQFMPAASIPKKYIAEFDTVKNRALALLEGRE